LGGLNRSGAQRLQLYNPSASLAPAEKWAEFSERWQAVLDLPPKLEYFKMKEAWSLHGEFEGWSAQNRNQRLELFYRVIEEFVSAEFSIGFRPDALKRAFSMWPKKFSHPYYFAVPYLTAELARGLENLGLSQEPISFIYDDQMHEKATLIEAWEWGHARSRHDPPQLKEIMSRIPSFENDKRVLPLQAADFLAWWLRRNFVAQVTGKEIPKPPFEMKRSIRRMDCQFNEAQLRDLAKKTGTLKGSITARFGFGV